jgi:transcription termination factor Rho
MCDACARRLVGVWDESQEMSEEAQSGGQQGDGGGAKRRSRRRRGKGGGGGEASAPSANGAQQHAPKQHAPKPPQPRKLRELEELVGLLSSYTAIQPSERLRLEQGPTDVIGRLVDMIAPIGKGQRCLVTSPPKAGKTTILQSIARSVIANQPEVEVYALLVDERPEEATDFKRNVPCTVVASTSDMTASQHVKTAEKVFREAIDKMLQGKDVLVLLDSITRLARAYNVTSGSSGKILSGGIMAGALDRPRQLFGAARKLEEGGSLTIVATALIDTGSLMDEVIFQEFKGTGNLELILDRDLSQKRHFPAVDINPSGTRNEHHLLNDLETRKVPNLRRFLADMSKEESLTWLLKRIQKTLNNKELLGAIQ